MKHSKLKFICAGLLAVLVGVGLSLIPDAGQTHPRYQQHLEQPSEADLGPCTVCDGTALCTHLPIISIETGGQKIPGKHIVDKEGHTTAIETGINGEEEILVQVTTVNTENQWHHTDDAPSLMAKAMFRIRGNSSRAFDKSSYRIAFVEDQDPLRDRKEPLLGMPEESEWALHGPFMDKTLIRNYLGMNISAMVTGDAAEVRFCELVIDGEYKGLYLAMETPTVSDTRTDLTKYDNGDLVMSYMVRIERLDDELNSRYFDNFTNYTYRMDKDRAFELLYPGRLRQTQQVKDYVAEDISEIERLLYSIDPKDTDKLFRSIDMDSFVDYYILMEYFGIYDVFNASTYFYRDARGALTVGPVWDFNNCFDNFFLEMPAEEFMLSERGWFSRLMKQPQFVEQVIQRWGALRESVLAESYLNDYIAETQAWLGSAVDRNFEVWGYAFDPIVLNSAQRRMPEYIQYAEPDSIPLEEYNEAIRAINPASFEEATRWMTDYMNTRGQWMDEYIHTLRQYCADSKRSN